MNNKFKIEVDEVISRLNPANKQNLIKKGDHISNFIENMIETKTDYILGQIPKRILDLTEKVDGEILIGGSKKLCLGGETELYVSLTPILGDSLILFKNYRGKPYTARNANDVLSSTEYSVDDETGKITLTNPLKANDVVIADYRHDALENCSQLREWIIALTIVEVARVYYSNTNNFEEIYTARETQVYGDLNRLNSKDQRLKIPLFDQLELVNPTAVSKMTTSPNLELFL